MEKLFDAEKGGISLGSCKRRALEGYGVDIVLIFTRDGAPVRAVSSASAVSVLTRCDASLSGFAYPLARCGLRVSSASRMLSGQQCRCECRTHGSGGLSRSSGRTRDDTACPGAICNRMCRPAALMWRWLLLPTPVRDVRGQGAALVKRPFPGRHHVACQAPPIALIATNVAQVRTDV